jgi:NTP pyrophosphatase (non-canonical NTP hydrolase)
MRTFQAKVRKFCEENKLSCSAKDRMLDLVSEIGEVSKELLKGSSYGKTELKATENTKMEMGDVLFSLTALANGLNIDLEEALNLVLEKYKKRMKKGSAGSEVE